MRHLILSVIFFLGCSLAKAERPDPKTQIDTFLATLGSDTPKKAVDDLVDGTVLKKQKGSEIDALVPQFEAAFKIYGSIDHIEFVDEKHFGPSFVRIRLITYHTSDAALFWDFKFLKAKNGWQVYIFRFNDQFDRVFPDA